MIFVILARFTKKPTKAELEDTTRMFAQQEKMGVKTLAVYWTFGRYDSVRIVEAADEKSLLRSLMHAPDYVQTETLLAMKREDAIKLHE